MKKIRNDFHNEFQELNFKQAKLAQKKKENNGRNGNFRRFSLSV
jgi:hypothetical protein